MAESCEQLVPMQELEQRAPTGKSGGSGEGGGEGGGGSDGGDGDAVAQISKPPCSVMKSDFHFISSPAIMGTDLGPLLPLYSVPWISM